MMLPRRPLNGWTKPDTPHHKRHGHSYFNSTWSQTVELLERELEHLGATNVVLQMDVTEDDIRLDGRIRANARPATPRVRIVFDSRHGQLSYETDAFVYWQHGVRAIALGLEALRKVDRYGITNAGQQYKGWLQIEAAPAAETPRQILVRFSGIGYVDGEPNEQLWRMARANVHPDRHGGSREAWDQVESAAHALGLS